MSRPVTVLAILVCALIWGTTWFAITLQLGPVDPVVSIVWRFGLAAVLLHSAPIRMVAQFGAPCRL